MSRLVRVELRRLFARRFVLALMLGSLAVPVLLLVSAWQSVQPPTPAAVAEAERFYAEAVAMWEADGEEMLAQCEADEEAERARSGADVDFGCEFMGPPQRSDFLFSAPPFHEVMQTSLLSLTPLAGFLGVLVGATATAAEFSTGSMGTWLTFEPRRMRVYASKVLAPGLGVVPVAVVILALALLGSWVIYGTQDLAGGTLAHHWRDAAWTGARLVVLAGGAAVVGAALGFLLRHVAAVLGVVIAYGVVAEGLGRGLLPQVQPYLVLVNVTAWAADGTTYYVEECTTTSLGMTCDYTDQVLTLAQSAGYLAALTVLLVGAGAFLFHRRDVT
ncbi:hypothetical protein [Georgenia wangjunii]|uniref:hypothetical protein n=1 Tax=Georgenia wangjunii TaxID=3117730 RepID=UPI002F263B05